MWKLRSTSKLSMSQKLQWVLDNTFKWMKTKQYTAIYEILRNQCLEGKF